MMDHEQHAVPFGHLKVRRAEDETGARIERGVRAVGNPLQSGPRIGGLAQVVAGEGNRFHAGGNFLRDGAWGEVEARAQHGVPPGQPVESPLQLSRIEPRAAVQQHRLIEMPDRPAVFGKEPALHRRERHQAIGRRRGGGRYLDRALHAPRQVASARPVEQIANFHLPAEPL